VDKAEASHPETNYTVEPTAYSAVVQNQPAAPVARRGRNQRRRRPFSAARGALHCRCRDGATSRRTGAQQWLRLAGQKTLALRALARELAGAADRFRLLPRLLFGGLFVVPAQLHLAENAFALHLFLQRLEGLVDIVVTDENLHASSSQNGLE